jgi:hypothetical protein
VHAERRVFWLLLEPVQPVVHCLSALQRSTQSLLHTSARFIAVIALNSQRVTGVSEVRPVPWRKHHQHSVASETVDVAVAARYGVHHNREKGRHSQAETFDAFTAQSSLGIFTQRGESRNIDYEKSSLWKDARRRGH